ncbi:unnamed protein product [Brassica rapa]|uniref:Uncharacterized protein n=2 Tax=Brassica TaxID=3705 RepID=A0A8D9HCD4_BRACM|nr:unnamed protein product [Brassica napus]CAG7897104.1 unnamed protein product [Brassica rapa]
MRKKKKKYQTRSKAFLRQLITNILNDDSDPVKSIKNSDDAEQASHEVTGDREKEEDIPIHKAQEMSKRRQFRVRTLNVTNI